MSAANKVLLIFCAITAFAVGWIINSAQTDSQFDTQALLSARLLKSEQQDDLASVGDSLSQLTLVNFWASWCAPCRQEMPIFEAMYRQSSADGFAVIGVAIDNPQKAQPMLDSMDISYPILYAENTGMLLMESSGNPQGLLPYSLLLDKQGNVIEQVIGQIHEQQIADWIAQHL